MTFEIAVALLFILFFILYYALRDQRVVVFAAGFRLLLLALIIHLALEGFLLPFTLLYASLALILVLSVKTLWLNASVEAPSNLKKTAWTTAFTLSVAALILVILFPA